MNETAAIDSLRRSLLAMDRLSAEAQIREALTDASPLSVVEGLIAPTLEAIGDGWESGEVALSQVYMSSRISEDLVSTVLQPGGRLRNPQPSMAIVVLEDYHLLGKRIIHSVLRAAGYEVTDFGQMDLDSLVARLEREPHQVLFVSTLMLRAALRIGALRKALDARGADIKLVVGGAPFRFDPALADEVGAYATAASAAELMSVVAGLVEGTEEPSAMEEPSA